MELLFYSGIVSVIDWKYTKPVGIKNQVFWAGLFSPFSFVTSGDNRYVDDSKFLGVY